MADCIGSRHGQRKAERLCGGLQLRRYRRLRLRHACSSRPRLSEDATEDAEEVVEGHRGSQPPKHSLHTHDQFAQIGGLAHVIVGTALQSHHFVHSIASAGDDDEAATPTFAYAACDRKPVFVGRSEVLKPVGVLADGELNPALGPIKQVFAATAAPGWWPRSLHARACELAV